MTATFCVQRRLSSVGLFLSDPIGRIKPDSSIWKVIVTPTSSLMYFQRKRSNSHFCSCVAELIVVDRGQYEISRSMLRKSTHMDAIIGIHTSNYSTVTSDFEFRRHRLECA
ncbi:hypothetical protein Y032_0006g3108 [Ancylostoma ceylanicum]|uniref:Uncharacterized protein n=1 Tax=Ancylostoma ceylanicum TaxID=53326 RepID=A0A016VRK1_9BILA|nr:hypothetical protein Y032_0006g3108 [Ancylostoma ceylanicum]